MIAQEVDNMNCPRCGYPGFSGVCDNCGFPIVGHHRRWRKIALRR